MQTIFEANEELASCKIFSWQSNSGKLSKIDPCFQDLLSTAYGFLTQFSQFIWVFVSIEQQKCIATSRATLPCSDILHSPGVKIPAWRPNKVSMIVLIVVLEEVQNKKYNWYDFNMHMWSYSVLWTTKTLFKQLTNPNRCLNVSSLCFWAYRLCILHTVYPWTVILAPFILCYIKLRSHFLVFQDIQVACDTGMLWKARLNFFCCFFCYRCAVGTIFTNKKYL